MRTLTNPAALLLATVFAAGCSDQKAPTELSEGEFGPQFNQAPEVFTFSASFPEFNPCTGVDHTIFIDLTVREHEFGNGPNFHINAVVLFDVTSSDGFSGSAVQHITLNDNNAFNVSSVTNVNTSNDSGQRITLHLRFLVTITDGGVLRVFVDEVSSRCVGKPGA